MGGVGKPGFFFSGDSKKNTCKAMNVGQSRASAVIFMLIEQGAWGRARFVFSGTQKKKKAVTWDNPEQCSDFVHRLMSASQKVKKIKNIKIKTNCWDVHNHVSSHTKGVAFFFNSGGVREKSGR